MRRLLHLLLLLGLAVGLRAAEVIPPPPARHFTDAAGVVDPAMARQLDAELAQLERDTSNQVLVAIYPHIQSDSSIEDYTQRVAQAWHAGTKGRNNGAVLFIFSQDRKVFIEVGYGLEGVLPDALCKQIIENELTPRFRAGDFTGGVAAGVSALIAATKGEYKGTGRTAAESNPSQSVNLLPLLFIIVLIIVSVSARRRGAVYGRSGRSAIWLGGFLGGGGFGGGGGGGGGGGFSGGGGSFGGGGAGGSW